MFAVSDRFDEQLVVQLPMGLGEDDLHDLDLRNEVGEEIEAALAENDLGEYDGADIGSGTMNLFAYVDPERFGEAVEAVRSILDDRQLLDVAVIARRDATDDESEPVVVWPEDGDLAFSY